MDGQFKESSSVGPDKETFEVLLTSKQGHAGLDENDEPPTDGIHSTKLPTFKTPKHSNSVQLVTQAYGILQNKATDLDKHHEFHKNMKDILAQDRLSAMKNKVQESYKTLAQVEQLPKTP